MIKINISWRVKLLAIISIIGSPFLTSAAAHAAAITWDGSAGDGKFSTAANWVGDAVPVDGDSVILPDTASYVNATVVQDIVDLDLVGLSFTGTSSTIKTLSIYPNISTGDMGLSGTINLGDNKQFFINEPVVLNGNVTISQNGYNGTALTELKGVTFNSTVDLANYTISYNVTGTIPTDYPDLPELRFAAGSTVTGLSTAKIVATNAEISFGDSVDLSAYTGSYEITNGMLTGKCANLSAVSTNAITLTNSQLLCFGTTASSILGLLTVTGNLLAKKPSNGNTLIGYEALKFSNVEGDVTLAGGLTLGSDIVVGLPNYSNYNLKITGPFSGNYLLGFSGGQTGKKQLILSSSANTNAKVSNGTYDLTTGNLTATISDNTPTIGLIIQAWYTRIVNGSRGDVIVASNGVLKGSGTVGNVTVYADGVVAPGNSPGCLKTSNIALSGGVYKAELGGTTECTEYDQLTVTGTVALGTNVTTLSTSLYNSYKPAKDSKYTIIKNDGTDAVTGTFKDLAEGATFKVDGYTFTITYKGGDGNDVVLTMTAVPEAAPAPATPAPAAPDTGFGMLRSNPAAVLAVGMATLAVLAMGYLRKRFARN